MKSMKKAVAMFLSLSTMLSMTASPVWARTADTSTEGTAVEVQADTEEVEQTGVQVTTYENVTKIEALKSTANAANKASGNYLKAVDYYGATITNSSGTVTVGTEGTTLITVTKDGAEITPAEATYESSANVTVTVTNYLTDTNLGSWTGLQKFGYRSALVLSHNSVDDANSVTSAIQDEEGATASYDAAGIKNAKITAATSGFSGLINIESAASVEGSTLTMNTGSDGQDVNDFAGYGAAVATYGSGAADATTKTTVKDSTITTTGVAKLATFADNGADIVVENSTLKANGGTIYGGYKSTANQSYMINPPWVLGIAGSVRTTNVMGENSTGTYVDSTIESANWGAISTDTGSKMLITAVNDTIKVDGSGYGAYVIGDGTQENYYGSKFDVQTYAIILTGGEATLTSYTGGDSIEVKDIENGNAVTTATSAKVEAGTTVNSSVTSTGYGFMFHANGSDNVNVLNLEKGTTVETGKTAFLMKKVNNTVNIDSATVTPANGVLLQVMDNDDDMVGAFGDDVFGMPTFNDTLTETTGWSNTWNTPSTSEDHFADAMNVTNATLEGDIFNATGYVGGPRANPGADLDINLGTGATLTGAITESAFQHTYKTFTYRKDSYDIDTASAAAAKLGDVQNLPAVNANSSVNVTLTDDAVWNVTGSSSAAVYSDEAGTQEATAAANYTDLYIDSLSISGNAKVVIPANITLHVGDKTYGGAATEKTLVSVNGTIVEVDGISTGAKIANIKSITALGTTANAAGISTDGYLTAVDYHTAVVTTTDDKTYLVGGADKLITVTQAHKEIVPATGDYTDANATITVTDYLTETNLGSWNGLQKFAYRAGIVIENGELDTTNSVTDAIADMPNETAITNKDGLKDAKIDAATSGFSAMINIGSAAKVEDSEINLDTDSDGQDVNDFAGYGAAVATYGTGADDTTTKTTITGSTIETTGVAKLATFVDKGADLIVDDSTLKANGGTIYGAYKSTANQSFMINPPWVLGITGSVRTTNVMGTNSTGTYVDSTIESDSWGAVSTDSGSAMLITAINDKIKVDGSGYGAYVIGDTTVENYYGSSFDVNTYAIIMTGGTAKLTSYTGGDSVEVKDIANGNAITTVASDKVAAGKTVASTVTSTGYGFMFHANGSDNVNNLTLEKGTTVSTGKTTFLMKKVNNNINIDDSTVTSANGVLLQVMDNDDDMVGIIPPPTGDPVFGIPTFNDSLNEAAGWSDTWTTANSSAAHYADTLNVTNTALAGDIYNATGYTSANPAADLTVNICTGASISGAITESAFQHTYKTFTYREDSYDLEKTAEAASKLGDVQNKPTANANSKINVVLTDDAVWNVSAASSAAVYTDENGTSVATAAADYTDLYIDSLSVSGKAKVVIPAGITLHVGSQVYDANTATAALVITASDTYTVNTSTPKISVADKTVTYGTAYEMNARTASEGVITYTYYTDAACTKALTAAPTDAGTYYVKATVAANGVYKAATSKTAKLVIKQAASSVTLAAKSVTYNGKAVAIAAAKTTGSTGKVTYTYYSDSKCTKTVKASAVKNAGTYYVKATVAGTTNYAAATSSAVKLTIKKANPTAKLSKKTFSYTGKKVALKITATSKAGSVSYKYYNAKGKRVLKATALKKKGSYTVKVTIKGNKNYNKKTISLKYKIK